MSEFFVRADLAECVGVVCVCMSVCVCACRCASVHVVLYLGERLAGIRCGFM